MRVAAIDIGTHSLKLLVADTAEGCTFRVVTREQALIRMGRDLFSSGRLSEHAFEAGIEAMRRFSRIVENARVDHVEVVATTATREAENGTAFVDAIMDETGLLPVVVSGQTEGTLIYRAVRHALEQDRTPLAVLDIGGGSVNLVVGAGPRAQVVESLRLGVERLQDRGPRSDRPTSTQLDDLRNWVRSVATAATTRAVEAGFDQVVGTSGTIRAITQAALIGHTPPVGGRRAAAVPIALLRALADRLCSVGEPGRAAVPGIPAGRAETIHLGAIVLVELLDLLGAETIVASEAALREGVLLDLCTRHSADLPTLENIPTARRRTICHLARRYGRNDWRDRHIADLSLQIFDQLQPIHGLGPDARDLLEFAARLHAIGKQIDFHRRNEHSAYIIRHTPLPGFTEQERESLALVARYHREAKPSKKHPDYKDLPRDQRRLVALLSGMLRTAVALDRGQTGQVRRLEASANKLEITILAHGSGDLGLELGAARSKTMPLAELLGRRIRVISAEIDFPGRSRGT